MAKFSMNVSIRKLQKDPNMFEFIIATPMLKSQFLLPRAMLNRLRILIEKALTSKAV